MGYRTGWAAAIGLLLCGCSASAGYAQPGELESRELWEQRKPATYSFTLDAGCGYRTFHGRYEVTVDGGDVVSARGLDEGSRYSAGIRDFLDRVPTLDDLLDELDHARREEADRAAATLDPQDGHVTSIDLDYSQAVDDEACYEISGYEAGGQR